MYLVYVLYFFVSAQSRHMPGGVKCDKTLLKKSSKSTLQKIQEIDPNLGILQFFIFRQTPFEDQWELVQGRQSKHRLTLHW